MTQSSLIPHHVVLGMAGHIDHGKTSLVKALTGVDTDRLKEEKERGMTTDLGFAFMGNEIAIIDVPGHERFVKTMVAGVTAVDMAMLVVAADDGVMPQTREHLEILRLLRIPAGLVALNKVDLVDAEWLQMVKNDLASLLEGTMLERAPVIPVSAVTGEGLGALREAIAQVASSVRRRPDKGVFRLPIDRIFTIKGFGTVVAGTVLSGTIRVDDEVELLPQSKVLRVRGLQVHDCSVTESGIGQRTAVNLLGAEKDDIQRGDVLCAPGYFAATSMADVRLSYIGSAGTPLGNRTRVHVHVGTNDVVARALILDRELLLPGEEGYVQLHFERPVVVDDGDRFVVRSYSPVQTVAGGTVLDPHPSKHKRFQADVQTRLEEMVQGDPAQRLLDHLLHASRGTETTLSLAKSASLPADQCVALIHALAERSLVVSVGPDTWSALALITRVQQRIVEMLDLFHGEHPLRLGMPAAEIHSRLRPVVDRRLFDAACAGLLEKAVVERRGDRLSLRGFSVKLSREQQATRDRIAASFLATPLSPPAADGIAQSAGKDGDKIAAYMIECGELLRLEEGVVIHRDGLDLARKKLREYFATHQQGTLSELRQFLGISRKYAVPIMTQLDAEGFTEREGDVRTLKNPHPLGPPLPKLGEGEGPP